ncbi:MAG: hypothetical protein LBM13_00520 [Candidatus Ancillula sp.]|jgi:glucan phosphoethanolaminetransferase (alkaline phosphatase superfamily)|nr:hypothetical protein [Candidatus Ancillula sp.]
MIGKIVKPFILIIIAIGCGFLVKNRIGSAYSEIAGLMTNGGINKANIIKNLSGTLILAFVVILALIILIILSISFIVKAGGWGVRIISLISLFSLFGFPVWGYFSGVDSSKTVIQSQANNMISNQLEKEYGSNYKSVLQDKINKQSNSMTEKQKAEAQKALDTGDYKSALKDVDPDYLDSKLKSMGIDPDSPLVKQVLDN